MNILVIDRIKRICDESRQKTGETTFWFTQDKISNDDLLQVFSDFGLDGEYGFIIKNHDGDYYIYFCVLKYERKFFWGRVNPHAMKSKTIFSAAIDIKNMGEADIQEWFEYSRQKFKKRYRPRLIARE